jgi:hypothetical protein
VYRALLLTGVAGVGKTTVADAAGHVLATAGHMTAVVDTDMLAQIGPPPGTHLRGGGGGFYDELKCANLAALWANFKTAGAQFRHSRRGRRQLAPAGAVCPVPGGLRGPLGPVDRRR